MVFVDGLRMDLAHRLATLLWEGGVLVSTGWRVRLPDRDGDLQTARKPRRRPALGRAARGIGPTHEGKPATKPALARAIETAGWACGETLDDQAPLWLEGRSIDRAGEDNGAGLVVEIILEDIAETVLRLARQGRRVRVVTDHGFLLMPGGLPQAELAARCRAATRTR